MDCTEGRQLKKVLRRWTECAKWSHNFSASGQGMDISFSIQASLIVPTLRKEERLGGQFGAISRERSSRFQVMVTRLSSAIRHSRQKNLHAE